MPERKSFSQREQYVTCGYKFSMPLHWHCFHRQRREFKILRNFNRRNNDYNANRFTFACLEENRNCLSLIHRLAMHIIDSKAKAKSESEEEEEENCGRKERKLIKRE